MGSHSAKIAISLPRETYDTIEKIRHELGLGRSAVIFEALKLWLKSQEQKKLEDRYVDGYRKKPEKISDHGPMFDAGLASFDAGDW